MVHNYNCVDEYTWHYTIIIVWMSTHGTRCVYGITVYTFTITMLKGLSLMIVLLTCYVY